MSCTDLVTKLEALDMLKLAMVLWALRYLTAETLAQASEAVAGLAGAHAMYEIVAASY